MKRKPASIIIVTMLTLAAGPQMLRAQTIPGSMLFSPNVDLSSGAQNGYVGYVGGIFLTSFDYYPKVDCLGYFDKDGDGLANSHVVSLWDNSAGNTLLASVTVPAGTSAPLINGFRWVQLPTAVDLTYNNYYIVDAQVDNVDTWGDFLTNDGGAGQISWSSQYVNLQNGYEFSRAGRYGANPPENQSGTDAIYPAANLGYQVVPEPTTLSLLGFGMVALLRRSIQRKR